MAVQTMLRQNTLYPGPEMILLFLASLDVMLTHHPAPRRRRSQSAGRPRFRSGGHVWDVPTSSPSSASSCSSSEFIGSREFASGRRPATVGIAISMLPIVVALILPEIDAELRRRVITITMGATACPSSASRARSLGWFRGSRSARPEQRLEAVAEDEVVLWNSSPAVVIECENIRSTVPTG